MSLVISYSPRDRKQVTAHGVLSCLSHAMRVQWSRSCFPRLWLSLLQGLKTAMNFHKRVLHPLPITNILILIMLGCPCPTDQYCNYPRLISIYVSYCYNLAIMHLLMVLSQNTPKLVSTDFLQLPISVLCKISTKLHIAKYLIPTCDLHKFPSSDCMLQPIVFTLITYRFGPIGSLHSC